MSPEPLPFDRKEFFKDSKASSSEPVGIGPPRWREPATIPQHNNRGSFSSCRWGVGGGPSDFRRPFSGVHGKRIGGGWDHTAVESGSKENNCITSNSVSMAFGSQKDHPKEGNSWEKKKTASPNGKSLPPNGFMNSSDQLQSVDQHAKNSGGGGGFSTANSQRLEKDVSLGSWKPLKWMRSGSSSLSARGSGFSSHSSGIGVDPLTNNTCSEDAGPCVDEAATSRKKQRLGWGEGLAKYEKKKVDPSDDEKAVGAANQMVVDGVSGSVTSPCNFSDKSPSVNCASPYSFASSSSPGLEEKESTKIVTVDELRVTEEDSRFPGGSGFVKSTAAMDELQVWKTEVTRTLEITETDIDSLEKELKSLVSDEASCPFPPVASSSSFLTGCSSNKSYDEENCGPLPVEKTDSSPEQVKDSYDKSPDTASEFGPVANWSEDQGDDGSEVITGSSSSTTDSDDADNGREDDKLYDLMLDTNKVEANRASDELSRNLLPTGTPQLIANVSKASDESLISERFSMRMRFLKLKERILTNKFRALQYSWKEDVHLLCTRKCSSAKSQQKKFESSSRMEYYADHQKCRSPGGVGLSMVPTTETLDYVKKLLLSDSSRVRKSRMSKMPCLILDRSVRTMKRFGSENGLVENPADVEKERSILSSWREIDKEIFLEKYSLFGKDFKKIASFLEHRTIGDCVEFYYKNHKSDCFQKAKKDSKFAKAKSCGNTYLVTCTASGRRLNSEGVASLEMLGAASAMVANGDGQLKKSRPIFNHYHVDTSASNNDGKIEVGTKRDFGMLCSEQETAAADVLAGISKSSSSSTEALGGSCCITSVVDHGEVVYDHHHHHHQKFGDDCSRRRRQHLTPGNDVDEGSCSSESCGEDEGEGVVERSYWTDEEKVRFIKAFRCEGGKDFMEISRRMRTKTADQCRVFFSKARKCLGLDDAAAIIDDDDGSEGGGGGGSDDKSCLECSKMDKLVENNYKEEEEAEVVGERRSSSGSNGIISNLELEEGAAAADRENKGGGKRTKDESSSSSSTSTSAAAAADGSSVAGAGKICREEGISSNSNSNSNSTGRECRVEENTSDNGFHSLLLDSSINDDGHGIKINTSEKEEEDDNNGNGNGNGSGLGLVSKSFPQDSTTIGGGGGGAAAVDVSSTSTSTSTRRLLYERKCWSRGHDVPKHSSSSMVEAAAAAAAACEKVRVKEGDDGGSSEMPPESGSSNLLMKKPTKTSSSKGGGEGDVKLFGQILTKRPPQQPEKEESGGGGGGKSLDNGDRRRKAAVYNVAASTTLISQSSQRESDGYWEGKRIRMIPDSARLLAKYPAAFSKTFTPPSSSSSSAAAFFNFDYLIHQQQQQHHLRSSYNAKANGVVVDNLFSTRKKQMAIRLQYTKNGQAWTSAVAGGAGDILDNTSQMT